MSVWGDTIGTCHQQSIPEHTQHCTDSCAELQSLGALLDSFKSTNTVDTLLATGVQKQVGCQPAASTVT